MKKESFSLPSADGKSDIKGVIISPENPNMVLQLLHGMAEHLERYDEFCSYMAENGCACVIHNHIGHKDSSDDENLGFVSEINGDSILVEDAVHVFKYAKRLFPNLPIALFGHSMGSFVARIEASEIGDELCALVVSGTGGPNPLAPIAIKIIQREMKKYGVRGKSELVQNLVFGSYNKRFEKRTDYDWLSRDKNAVDNYLSDPYCGFEFKLAAMENLVTLMKRANSKEWFNSLPQNLPVLLLSGENDPVGNYGKGVRKVYDKLKEGGLINIKIKLFKDGRHEMLNEINKDEVYEVINMFLQENKK